MKTIRALIVDDEELARDRLRSLLKPFPDVEVVGEAANGEDALEKIAELHPDVAFLDIQMPGCTGIEVAASLPSDRPAVVFCTAYDQYAIDAFEVRAIDYLLKPVSRDRLARAVDRIRDGRSGGKIAGVMQAVTPERFLARRGQRFKVIPVEEVACFVSEEGLTQLWARGQNYWMEPSLSELEERLEAAGFFRISRQALVSLAHVVEVVPLIGGHGHVTLDDGRALDVSRRRMKVFMGKLEGR